MKGLIKFLIIITLSLAITLGICMYYENKNKKPKENFCIFGIIGNTCSQSSQETTPEAVPKIVADVSYKAKSEHH